MDSIEAAPYIYEQRSRIVIRFGDPWENRTPVCGVRGRRLDRLTNGPRRNCIYSAFGYPRRVFAGAPSRTRTGDPLIKSQLLYQLS